MTTTHEPITEEELDEWERWQRRQTVMKPECDRILCLIAEVRRLRSVLNEVNCDIEQETGRKPTYE